MPIRRAVPADLEEVGRITVGAYAPYLGGESDYVSELRDAARRDREAELWVAVDDDDTLLGSVTACPEGSPWRELAQPGEGEFRTLAVEPPAQGRGVGRALVEHVVARFREAGATDVVLCSMSTMAPAHRLYQRLGFERDEALDWSPVDGVHLIAYRLGLGPGSAPRRRPPG
ncbi:MAG: GNAT family N-acetyltransferase [Nocardioides sp.]